MIDLNERSKMSNLFGENIGVTPNDPGEAKKYRSNF